MTHNIRMKTRINIYLDEEIKEKLTILAAISRRSLSQMIEILILKAASEAKRLENDPEYVLGGKKYNLQEQTREVTKLQSSALKKAFPNGIEVEVINEKSGRVREEPLEYGSKKTVESGLDKIEDRLTAIEKITKKSGLDELQERLIALEQKLLKKAGNKK